MAQLVHPDRPLERGFVRVTSRDGRTLRGAAAARAEKLLSLHFSDGVVEAEVQDAARASRVERPQRRPYLPPQPGLFDAPEE
jgi:exodeoxyribonuclease VII large subunit